MVPYNCSEGHNCGFCLFSVQILGREAASQCVSPQRLRGVIGPLLFSLSACKDGSTMPQRQGSLGSAQLLLAVLELVGTVLWLTLENRGF